ncbi:hypothetical protein [Pedobacter sp. KLB.chiD]|uniref:hypothetical protein n=1 Tax=Pedobacter sp. KLB.chiD TaxID=3387402 RepID=UPI00399B5BAB
MKKFILLAMLIVFLQYVHAQVNVFPDTGKVGIGTATPRSHLEIKEWIPSMNIASDKYTEIMVDNEVIGSINFYKHYSIAHAAAIKLLHAGGPTQYGQAHLAFYTSNEWNPFNAIPSERMRIASTGEVMIGTTLSHGYKFSVNGNIRAKEIRVETSDWPDYVFEETYPLESLQQVEQYIKDNKRLPGFPAAKDIEQQGLALGDMLNRQQKKIEELTLYLIEKDKVMQSLLKRIEELEKKETKSNLK